MPRLYAILDSDYGQSSFGPFDGEEARDQAMRQQFSEQDADPLSDVLFFGDLDDNFELNVYHMDMQDFMPDEDDDDDDAEEV